MRELPCGLLHPGPEPAAALAEDGAAARELVAELRAAHPDLGGWVNVPLRNASGAAEDYAVGPFAAAARATPLAARLPAAARVVDWALAEGLDVELARVAVLAPGAQLRAHVDEYPALRLLVALDEDPDFRHVFGPLCVSLRAGEVWGVDGEACHGAANLSPGRERAVLLLDARPATSRLPDWYRAEWTVPAARRLPRPAFDPAAVEREARTRLPGELDEACPEVLPHEEPWLRAPYSRELEHAEAYAALVGFCEQVARERPGEAARWRARASFWEARACKCVPLTTPPG
ncbi:MAG: aspartyl/asparaginyl beta-hydroxylase domain-containing protein [Planctomycetota bacterium]